MVYAPVVLTTLNRIEHLKKCIGSLQKNTYAERTDIYIALDYPPSQEYEEGYALVKEYLASGIEGFNKVEIVYRDRNYGPIENGLEIQKYVLSKYDRIICSEDDNVYAPCFLEYMNKALDQYKDREDILAIYSYGPRVKRMPPNEVYIANYFSGYGCGYWREKERQLTIEINRKYIEELSCDKSKIKRLIKSNPESLCYLASILLRKEPIYQTVDGTIQLIDTVRIVHAIAENKFLLCSPIPMVKNLGYDGSGVHCEVDNAKFSDVHVCENTINPVTIVDKPVVEQLDYSLKFKRIVPFVSAVVRIWVWRIIAKRRSF